MQPLDDAVSTRPTIKNLPASINAFERPGTVYQMTIGEQQPIQHAALVDMLDRLNSVSMEQFRLYFVVPHNRFTAFVKQNSVTQTGTTMPPGKLDARRRPGGKVEQWTLEFVAIDEDAHESSVQTGRKKQNMEAETE